MTSTSIENLPAIWDDARDVPFFRITASLFTPEFCCGASGLLASYDDTADNAPFSASDPASNTSAPADSTDRNPATDDLLPVRVRRNG